MPTSPPTTATNKAAIDASLDRASTRLLAEFGVPLANEFNTPWRGSTEGTAMSILGLTAYEGGEPVPEYLVTDLLSAQRAGGGFSSDNEPPTVSTTRLALISLERLLTRAPTERLSDAVERAREYLRAHADTPTESSAGLSDLLIEALAPQMQDRVPNAPFVDTVASHPMARLVSHVAGVNPQFRAFAPAVAVLFARQAEQQGPSWLKRGADLAALATGANQKLALSVLEAQQPDGSWGWMAGTTALGLLALKELGAPPSFPAVQAGQKYLRELATNQTAGRGNTWDTATALGVLKASLGTVPDPAKTGALRRLLDGRLPDGRWSFAMPGKAPDNDTTAVALRAMTQLADQVDPSLRQDLSVALQKALPAVLKQQQVDGGWGAFGHRSIRPFGKNPPGAVESMINDASSVDVTARMLHPLLEIRERGLVPPSDRAATDKAVAAAVAYMLEKQHSSGVWWTRWTAGGLSGFAFVVPALRHAGIPASHTALQAARRFIMEHQLPDGGWGETTDADKDLSLAGKGPSSPVQTAYALVGLMFSSPPGDPSIRGPVERGVQYLLDAERSGLWENHRPLYTIATGQSYYDTPGFTRLFVMHALALARAYQTDAEKALRAYPF